MTMNSPDAMAALFEVATRSQPQDEQVRVAELMREVGLKCIGFNGVRPPQFPIQAGYLNFVTNITARSDQIPRTINMLGAFRSSLPPHIVSSLSTTPSRIMTPSTIEGWKSRGLALWASVYRPFQSKLLSKLSDSHPDLPVHIINSNYAPLFTDPESRPVGVRVGRVLTSLVAIACLRAQTGVAPQVTSHVFGLRKALEDGSWRAEEAMPEEGTRWLATEEGNRWILETVDSLVEAMGQTQGQGTTFAPGIKAKL
jgi:hypothetical protein